MTDLPRPTAFANLDPHDLAALLNWLSAVFAAPPDCETVAAYRRGRASEWLSTVALISNCASGVAQMREALDAAADDSVAAARIGAAYGLLFEGIGGPKTVSPYESVQCSGRLFGLANAEMEAFLAAHNFSVAASAHEAADHIAVELAAAARLLAEGEPGGEAMIERLRNWAPAFAAACVAADSCQFWAGAAKILISVVGRSARRPGSAVTEDAVIH